MSNKTNKTIMPRIGEGNGTPVILTNKLQEYCLKHNIKNPIKHFKIRLII